MLLSVAKFITSKNPAFFNIVVRGVGFEPTNLYRIGS